MTSTLLLLKMLFYDKKNIFGKALIKTESNEIFQS